MVAPPPQREPRDSAVSFLDQPGAESEWIVRDDLAIFDEHEEKDSSGNIVRYGMAELQEYADNCNRRYVEHGVPTPLMIGHIGENVAEKDLGDIVGYAKQFKIGRFGPKHKLAVLCRAYFRKDKYDLAREFPRISVERWGKDKIFDPICLLKRTPKLDLGIWAYQRDQVARGSDRVLYLMPDDDTDQCGVPNMEEILPLLQQILQAVTAQAGQGQPYQAGMGSAPALPSGTNGSIPGAGGGQRESMTYQKPPETPKETPAATPPAPAAHDKEKQRMADESKAIEVARYEREKEQYETRLKAQDDRIAELSMKYQRAECEQHVIQLEAEGYALDRAEEVDALAALPDEAARQKYLGRVRQRYQKSGAPTDRGRGAPGGDGGPFIRLAGAGTEGGSIDAATAEADFERAVQYARDKSCDFDTAERAIKEQRQQGKAATSAA